MLTLYGVAARTFMMLMYVLEYRGPPRRGAHAAVARSGVPQESPQGWRDRLPRRPERESHVGSDEQRGHEILAEAGPHAAIALVRCKDGEMAQVAERATERGSYSWNG